MGISQVPEGREVFHDLTVKENLMMGAYLRRDRDGIHQDLETVHEYFPILKARDTQLAGNMSGGEQQMLAIARALMARPKLLLLDEPSLGLSPFLVKEIFQIIQRINQEQKTTILLVEQNALMALSLARIRVRPGTGADRHGRHLRRAVGERRREGVLSGHQGRGDPGDQAVEEEEEMALAEKRPWRSPRRRSEHHPPTVLEAGWEWGDRTAMREKDFGIWKSISWKTYGEKARHAGLGLMALGLEKGDRVAIISENNPEWLYSDMGIMAAGGVTVGIYPTDSPQQVQYVVNHSGAKFFVAEDEEQLDKILEVRDRPACTQEDHHPGHGGTPAFLRSHGHEL